MTHGEGRGGGEGIHCSGGEESQCTSIQKMR